MTDSAPPKILIRTPNWLGDLVMATGFFRAVLEIYPESQVDLIVKSGFENLPLPHRGKVIIFDSKHNSSGTFGKTLRFENYANFYILPPSFSSAWMAFQSRIPQRIGYAGEYRSLLLTVAKKHEETPRSQHLLKEYLNLLAPDLSAAKYPPSLETTEEWIETHINSFQKSLPDSFIVFTPDHK